MMSGSPVAASVTTIRYGRSNLTGGGPTSTELGVTPMAVAALATVPFSPTCRVAACSTRPMQHACGDSPAKSAAPVNATPMPSWVSRPFMLTLSVTVTLGSAMSRSSAEAPVAVLPAVTHSSSSLQSFGGTFGTIVSAAFLFLIGLLNLVVLAGIVKVFRSMRRGQYNEAELERQLENRGFFYRFFGKWMRVINKEWQLYPVGVVFGMGFDTATEVALLTTTALLASEHIAWQAIIALPILFTAGMCLMDTTDGVFMNLAYGWAFFNPVRKVFYNLAITGLSVAICFFIGGIETLSLVPLEVHGVSQTSGFWGFMYNFNINTAGFVIVGLFIATWAAAILIWRYGHIEEKWSARLQGAGGPETPVSAPWAGAEATE